MIARREMRVALVGARRVTAGNRDRGLDAHAGLIGILAGRIDLAQNVERPVGLDLDADMRLAEITVSQPRGDGLREGRRRQPARGDRTDQRDIHIARGIDEIGIAHAFLSEHRDPHPIAGIEGVGWLRTAPWPA